jgi:pSer/pThr/pTyr-binding forkhead associated (FHA) protein
MSEIALTVLKVLFLALLWLFILSAVSVIRSDLFGRTVPAQDQQPQELEDPARSGRKGRRPRGDPRIFSIAQGNQAGLSAELAGGVIMIGRGADCQLILDDDYVSTRHARVVSGASGIYVEDLGSTNGTYLDRAKVTSPTPVKIGVPIRVGKTTVELRK